MPAWCRTALDRLLPILGLVLGILGPVSADAAAWWHGLFVKASWQSGELRIEAFYDDDTPATQAKIIIADSHGAVLAQGVTNDQGVWRLSWRQPGKLTIRCDTKDGHRASTTLEVPAEAASVPASASSTPPKDTASAGGSESPATPGRQAEPAGAFDPASPLATDPLPSRQELTATPWSKVLLGLAMIAFLGFAVRQMLRAGNRGLATKPPPPAEPKR